MLLLSRRVDRRRLDPSCPPFSSSSFPFVAPASAPSARLIAIVMPIPAWPMPSSFSYGASAGFAASGAADASAASFFAAGGMLMKYVPFSASFVILAMPRICFLLW